jgi:hypothetical protein
MSVKGEVTKLKIAGAKIWTKLGNSPERHGGKSRGKYGRKKIKLHQFLSLNSSNLQMFASEHF